MTGPAGFTICLPRKRITLGYRHPRAPVRQMCPPISLTAEGKVLDGGLEAKSLRGSVSGLRAAGAVCLNIQSAVGVPTGRCGAAGTRESTR